MRTLMSAAVALSVASFGSSALAQNYSVVTDERLKNPEAENWLLWRGNYESTGHSPLNQINVDNIGDLVPVWSFSTGVAEGHQAPPIVNDGMMFVSTPQNQVIALDAASGTEIWRYVRELPEDLFQLHPTNRGVALYGDKVYMATVDAGLVALDAKTGKVVWAVLADEDGLRSGLRVAQALGASRWEIVYRVLFPAAKSGLLAAVLLGGGMIPIGRG